MAQSHARSQPSTTKTVANHKHAGKVAGSRRSIRGKRALSPSGEGEPVTKKSKGVLPCQVLDFETHPYRLGSSAISAKKKASSQAAAKRKAAAVIDPREDSSDESLDEELIAKGQRRAHHRVSEDDDEDSLDTRNSDHEADQEFEDGLEGLDAQSLRKTLASEASPRPQWSKSKAQRKAQEEDNVLNVPEYDLELTTASELDDHDHHHDEDDDEDEVPAQAISHRAKARLAEVPAWASDTEQDNIPTTTTKPHNEDGGMIYSIDAQYTPPDAGSALRLSDQPANAKAMIKAAIRQVSGDCLFEDGYPSVDQMQAYHTKVLVGACDALGSDFELLGYRVSRDRAMVGHISRVLSSRVSLIRSAIKKIAQNKIETCFQLGSDIMANQNKIRTLREKGSYIYPMNTLAHVPGELLRREKPFQHVSIISTLRDAIFTSTRGSTLAAKHVARFISTREDRPDELEVPIAMLCMVATAVLAAIDDWKTGLQKISEFSAETYTDTYRGHELFLKNIRDADPKKFHRLMADIYIAAAMNSESQSAKVMAKNQMALLDLDGMEE
ncbi:hypothetical protein H0H93_009625 [Arthromyces matolae]|nr:hypothetical protein H0H93_009625 [Arthromyces matolae]